MAAIGQVAISWKNRSRLTPHVVKNTEVSETLEDGQTTTIRVYNNSNALLRTVSGLTGTTYDYTASFEIADNGGVLSPTLRFEIESVRDGVVSMYKHNITITR